MIPKEYFKDWWKVIPKEELSDVLNRLSSLYKFKNITPQQSNVFKAFRLCEYKNFKVLILGQDPYPQKDIATGIAFGNNKEPLSPSLEILKEACIDYTKYHNSIIFDNTLESWCKQGVLLLNSSLTVELNKPNSHTMIWRKFIIALLKQLSKYEVGIIYVLLGERAQTFEPYINKYGNFVIKEKHPAYYVRINKRMPNIFKDINRLLNIPIIWYEEYGK